MGIWDKIKKVGKGILGGIPGAILGAVSSAFGASQQSKYNLRGMREGWDRSEAEALRVREFQERMSNTAYQRSMADMKQAGLNPILAYSQGGASSGFGAQANISGGSPGVNYRDVALTANELASAKAIRANLRKQNELIAAQRRNTDASTARTMEEARVSGSKADRAEVLTAPFRAVLDLPSPPPGASAADIVRGIGKSIQESYLPHEKKSVEHKHSTGKRVFRRVFRKWIPEE